MSGRTPYPQEMKERAVRMAGEIRGNYGNEYAAIRAVAARLGIGSPETVRKWLCHAQVDAGERPGLTSEEKAEIRALKQEGASSLPGHAHGSDRSRLVVPGRLPAGIRPRDNCGTIQDVPASRCGAPPGSGTFSHECLI